MMSSLLPSGFDQNSLTLGPLESPSSMHVGRVGTDLAVSLLDYQAHREDISISDTRMNIQGDVNWTHVDSSIHQSNGEMHTNQDVALPKVTIDLEERISMMRADSPQMRNLDRDSLRSFCRFSPRVTSILRKWSDENLYPNTREIIRLCGQTQLNMGQVHTWFSAERGRRKKGKGKESGVKSVRMTLKMKRNLPDNSVKVLKKWTENHSANPRPTITEKRFLSQESKLKLQQVSDWFANYRKKHRQLEIEEEDEGLIEMRGGLGMLDVDAQESRNNAKIQDQNVGFVFQPEQDLASDHDLDFLG